MNLYKITLKKDNVEFSILHATRTYNIMKVINEAHVIASKLNSKLLKVEEIENEKTESIMMGRPRED